MTSIGFSPVSSENLLIRDRNTDIYYRITVSDESVAAELGEEVSAFITSMEESDYIPYYYIADIVGVENDALMPLSMSSDLTEMKGTKEFSISDQAQANKIAAGFFASGLDFVRKITENKGSLLYMYGSSQSLIMEGNGTMRYSETFDPSIYRQLGFYDSLENAVEYVSTHGKWESLYRNGCQPYLKMAYPITNSQNSGYHFVFGMKKDGVTWYFLDNEQYFDRPELYGYVDDGERFGFFSRAVVKMLDHLEFWPDVIHCNDWQTALIPIYLKDDGVREDRYRSIRTVLTIHNIEYQGRYDPYCLGDLFGLDRGWVDDGTLLLDGDLNLLKGAILTADAVNAVSPTYAQELKNPYFAHRMEGILTQCGYKLSGVLNGIDMKLYNPAADGRITANYTAEDLSGKAADKTALQNLMGLNEEPNTPIIAMVSRLVSHKGLDLLREVMGDIMELPAQFVVLGSGDAGYEEFFRRTAERYPGRMAVRLGYNEALSMAIYAGADLFLMPSRSEPCGLSQMISMRYGTVPIVRETGGLKDTVQPYEAWRDAGTGFTFANYSSADMLHVIREAVYLYKDYPDAFARLRDRAMAQDFSWNRSAGDYLRIYGAVTGLSWEKSAPEAPAAEAAAPTEEPVIEVPAGEAAVSLAEPVSEAPAAEEAAAKPAAKKTARKTTAKKPAAKKTTTRKTAAKATTKKTAEKAAEKPTEKAAEKPVEKSAEEPVKKTAAKTTALADTVETTQPVQPKKKGAAKKAAK